MLKSASPDSELFGEFFFNSPQPMWIFDRQDYRFVAVNEAACRRYGYSHEEFMRLTVRDIRPKEDQASFDIHFESEERRRAGLKDVWRHLTKSGEVIYVEIISNDMYVDGKSLIGVVVRDVTNEKNLASEREKLLDITPDLMLARDFAGQLLWANGGFERVLGWTRADLDWIDPIKILHPDDREIRNQAFDELLSVGGTKTWESRYRAKSGAYHWFQWSATVDSETNKVYLVGRDIAEAKASFALLALSERHLAHAQRIAHVGSYSYEVATGKFRLSDEHYRIAGFEPGGFEPVWSNIVETIHPEDRHLVERGLDRGAWGREPVEVEVRVVRPNGEIRTVVSNTLAELDENDLPIRLEGVITDVTDRKAAQWELERFFNLSPNLLCIAGEDGYFKRINPAFVTTLGYSEAELLSTPFMELVHPDDLQITDKAREDLTRGAPLRDFTNRFRCKDGSYRWLSWNGVRHNGFHYDSAHDVTRLVEAELALREANEELEARIHARTFDLEVATEEAKRANLAKSEFLSRMSHELRTPLNAILGFGQVLALDDLHDAQRESVDHILRGGRHLLDLINEVLEVSRIESGSLALSIEPVEVSLLVEETRALLRTLAKAAGIRIDIDSEESPEVYVLADAQRLRQVLINLVSNGIKYNKQGGVVKLSWEVGPQWVKLNISDTGLGIRANDLQRLFTPFERLEVDGTIEGTGLGLVLSKRLVEGMGGRIYVESVYGVGSTFWVELRRSTSLHPGLASHQLAVRSKAAKKSGSPSKYSILVIEDNLSNLKLMEAILQHRPDIKLATATQGSVGVELAIANPPDLILIDLNLPDIHGSRVLAQLRESPSTARIPMVVISADATPNQRERLLEMGANDYLTKPLDVRQFLAKVSAILPE